jgi:membrane protease YdiL (CAAX protease family)
VFGVVLAASAVVSGALGLAGMADPTRPFGFLLSLVIVGLSYLATVWLFAVRTGALTWSDMGWPVETGGRIRRLLRATGEAVIVMVPTTVGVLLLGGILAQLLDVRAPQALPTPASSLEALAVAVAAAVVAPIGEEAFFRGFALTAWLRDLGARSAITRSATFFAAVHIINITADQGEPGQGLGQAVLQFAVILPLGLVLGWLFLRGGLAMAVAGHVTYNGLLLVLLALRSFVPTP